MAHQLFTIKKRATFVHVRNNGVFIRSKNLNVQRLIDQDLDNKIGVGYTATKKIGNAVSRNRAKRRMRSLVSRFIKEDLTCFDKQSSYVLVAKASLNKALFINLYSEMQQCLNKL